MGSDTCETDILQWRAKKYDELLRENGWLVDLRSLKQISGWIYEGAKP